MDRFFPQKPAGGSSLFFLRRPKEERERAKREGRGADTSSCGAIALQRKCDTFLIVSQRTTELPLARKMGGRGGRWCLVTDGQL